MKDWCSGSVDYLVDSFSCVSKKEKQPRDFRTTIKKSDVLRRKE